MDRRDPSWYVENFGNAEALVLVAAEAAQKAREAAEVAEAAKQDALAAARANEIFEGYPLSVDRFGEHAGHVDVSSPANAYFAKAYESAHSGQEGKWYVNLQDHNFPTYNSRKLVAEGGSAFHVWNGVTREQAVLEAKRWVAFQTFPATATQDDISGQVI